MKVKNKLIAIVTLAAISCSSSVVIASGIPVVDGAQIAQSAANFVKQIVEMKNQLEQQKKQYEAITGSRGFGNILTDTGLKQALPQDWQKVYQSIQNGGYKGLDGTAKALADAAKLTEKCKYPKGTDAQKTCETAAVQSAQTQSYISQSIDNATKRLDNLNKLAQKINSATDAKAIQDLQARIQIEQAAIQNENTRLMMFTKLAEYQEKHANDVAAAAARERSRKRDCELLGEYRSDVPVCN